MSRYRKGLVLECPPNSALRRSNRRLLSEIVGDTLDSFELKELSNESPADIARRSSRLIRRIELPNGHEAKGSEQVEAGISGSVRAVRA